MDPIHRHRLDVFTNVLLITVALLVAAQFFMPRFTAKRALAQGDTLPNIPGHQWKEATLVFALRKGCHYCEDSMPFYRQIVSLRNAGQLKVSLLAVFPDEGTIGSDLLKANKVEIPAISDPDMQGFRIQGTPTLILVDQNGKVAKTWVGELNSASQGELIETIHTISPSS